MGSIQAADFQAQCLALLEQVTRTGEPLMVTQNGQPFVEIRPLQPNRASSLFGLTAGTIALENDIIQPVMASTEWHVNQ